MTRRAGILTRISLDRDATSESPETQEAACRRWCDQNGAEVVGTYCDRNRSGFKAGVRREGFERLLSDLAAGRLDVVVVFKVDRLTRQGLTAVGRVLEALDKAGAVLASATEGFDSTTSMGQMILGNLACIAKAESENTSLRVRTANANLASKGKAHGGGPRCFGYCRDGTVDAVESAIVRELHGRILAGESLRQLAFELNARGVRTTLGNEWQSATLGQMLKSPKLRGCRSHNGELHKGDWTPVLSEPEHLALVEVLSDPRRISTRSGLRHLLTGTAVCGLCGGALKYMVMVNRNGSRFPRYQCVKAPGYVNCGRVAASMASLDRHVKTRLLAHLADGARQDPDPVEEGERERLAELADEDRRALEALTQDRYFHRSIGDGEYATTRAMIVERLAATEAALAHLDRPVDVELPETYDELEAWWEVAEVTERRAALRREVEQVVLHPARRRGGNVFDPDRAKIVWR